MATKPWREIRKKGLTAEDAREVEDWVKHELLEMDLRELRALAGLTQEQAAEAINIGQSQLSKIERGSDHLLSTLRRYVEALGGKLEVVAVIDNKRVTLKGV